MGNKIVYEDYAVGASTYAKVDLVNSDQQMRIVQAQEVDPYNADAIFGDTVTDVASLDAFGVDTSVPFTVFTNEDAGFISDRISGSDKGFATNPKLVIKFEDEGTTKYINGNGITITFSERRCTKVRVRYRLTNAYTEWKQYDIETLSQYLPETVQGYRGIEIEFVETELPNQYVKIKKIEFGRTFTIERFRSLSFNKKVDFYRSDIPIGTFDAVLISDEPLNFYKNQKIKVYRNDILFGTYWISESTKQTNKIYSITAEDSVSRLEKLMGKTVFVAKVGAEPLTITDVLGDYSDMISISGDTTKEIRGVMDDATIRRLVADSMFAFEKEAHVETDGTIVLSDSSVETPIEITDDKIIGESTYTLMSGITAVDVSFDEYDSTPHKNDTYDTIATNVTVTTDKTYVETSFIFKRIDLLDQNGDPLDSLTAYTYGRIDSHHGWVSSRNGSLTNVTIVASKYNPSERTTRISREVYEGEQEVNKSFGKRSLYRPDDYAWMSSVKNRAYSVTGEVNAKVVLNDGDDILDVWDQVTIKTAYSGYQTGTITEISADIGEKDIVGNVVITVWD